MGFCRITVSLSSLEKAFIVWSMCGLTAVEGTAWRVLTDSIPPRARTPLVSVTPQRTTCDCFVFVFVFVTEDGLTPTRGRHTESAASRRVTPGDARSVGLDRCLGTHRRPWSLIQNRVPALSVPVPCRTPGTHRPVYCPRRCPFSKRHTVGIRQAAAFSERLPSPSITFKSPFAQLDGSFLFSAE